MIAPLLLSCVQEIASASSFANRRGGPIGSPALLTGIDPERSVARESHHAPVGRPGRTVEVPLDPIERWGNGVTLRVGRTIPRNEKDIVSSFARVKSTG